MGRKTLSLSLTGILLILLLSTPILAQAEDGPVPQLVTRFMQNLASGRREDVLPLVTSASQRLLKGSESYFSQMKSVYGLSLGREYLIERTKAGLRVDFLPLLRFYAPLYLEAEGGELRVDFVRIGLQVLGGLSKEQVISIGLRSLRGIVKPDDVDVYETEHFLLFAHTGPIPAKKAEDLLEKLHGDFEQAFPFPAPGAPPRYRGCYPYLVVFLFERPQTYHAFAGRYDRRLGRCGGHANTLGYMATWFRPGYEQIVWHEGTHLLMSRRLALQLVPTWFAEGMAEFMVDARNRTRWVRKVGKWYSRGESPKLKSVLTRTILRGEKDYRVAEAVFHFLYERHRPVLWDYMAWLRVQDTIDHEASLAKLLDMLEMDMAGFEAAFWGYIRDRFPGKIAPPKKLEPVTEPTAGILPAFSLQPTL